MHFAGKYSEKVEKLVVVDIAPKYYPPHHQTIFEAFHSLDIADIKSRKEADEQLAAIIQDFGTRQFILKNLSREANGFSWKVNFTAIEKAIENVGKEIEQSISFNKSVLFIAGGDSDYISPDDYPLITSLFPSAQIETIGGAGHWVHAQKPEELYQMVVNFLG